MKDPNTALKSTSWCLCRKQSLAYTFTTFKSESFPMLLENTKWGRFELESYLMMLKTHTGVLCCFYKSMGCLEVLCVLHATRDFGATAGTEQRLKFLQQAQIWGFSPLSLFVSTLVHASSCCLSSPHTAGPQFTPKSPPMLLARSWPCVPLPRLLPDIPGMLQATIPSIYQTHLGLWPRQGAFSPRSALFKEESSSAPILHAEGRHPSQPVQACTRSLRQPGSVLSPDSCLLLLPQDGPPSPGESTQ